MVKAYNGGVKARLDMVLGKTDGARCVVLFSKKEKKKNLIQLPS